MLLSRTKHIKMAPLLRRKDKKTHYSYFQTETTHFRNTVSNSVNPEQIAKSDVEEKYIELE